MPQSTRHQHLTARLLPALLLLAAGAPAQQPVYYPGPGDQWEHRAPGQAGMDAALLNEAIEFAKANETQESRDLELRHYLSFGREPYGEAVGPFKTRGGMTGIVVRNGYIVAEWGEPHRVDMTFSVSKSFLSTTVGLALDRGLIRDVHDRVGSYLPTDDFDSEHNQKITWNHLLRQTSDWEGTLWGKPDWADRPPSDVDPEQWLSRKRNEPGTVYKYNDVRVNLLALAALHVWRRPLPQVLKEYVMDPIGASSTWRWYGYENSWITLDGLKVQSVSGGGHWGGGMFLSARDQARFGYFTLRRGKWAGKQLLSGNWFTMAQTPTKAQPGYGFMNYFLNTGKESMPSAPETAYSHRGAGTNLIYVDTENDLVVVARWIEGKAIDPFIAKVLASIRNQTSGGR
jgi:CubicO group peptidase (beta-lactamase class C family)